MSSNYTPSDQQGNTFFNGTLAVVFTVGVFAILPFLQFLDSMGKKATLVDTAETSVQPPPPPPEDQPPPPEEEKEVQEPEMEEPPPPMTLAQLEMALNPGSGDATGDFGFGDYDSGIDALAGMQIFSLADVDKKPSALVMSTPLYPYSMQQSKTKGRVIVEFVLDANGKVHRVRATKSTHREFEEPAIQCVQRSTWNPAAKDGKPVACKVRIPIDFSP
ncbi:energy transducer TonB [Pelagicoccus sp. NFK12]|uniref:Energy transducer TonB n=1 Tax=Pelagicoccus enzymogenes TaxID=2773457 RepID=A0A927F9F4_9BACT|nr:energy transducer TonB [Pelagicoccus enzymogenes]MBD5780759.1 energy transducer TonB [Pelagicoccus enzymogenes]MDQ8200077.1 energy transducer TonB [Pelagicoccus enzymogenes]